MKRGASGSRRFVAAALGVCLLATWPAGRVLGATKPYGAASPQELVARLEKASTDGDLGELMACMSPEDRKGMGAAMLMMAVMMVGFSQMAVDMPGAMAEGMTEALTGEEMSAEQKAELEAGKKAAAEGSAGLEAKLRAALDAQGLGAMMDGPADAEDGAMETALDKADMVALSESLMGILAELKDADPDMGMGEASPAGEARPDWTGHQVTGYAIDGDHATAQAGDETVEFVRVDGRWFLAPQMEMPGDDEDEPGGVDG